MVNHVAEHEWAGNRIEDVSNSDVPDSAVSNDDGPMQLANEELQSLLFSCQPTGAASDDPSGSAHNAQLMSHGASEAAGAAGPLRKRLSSAPPEHDWSGCCIKDVNDGDVPDSSVSNDDGRMQLANEELQSLLFSCQPMGAISIDPSGSAHNVQQISLFKLDGAKHKIFLSHAGARKDFVEQLCVDLERQGFRLSPPDLLYGSSESMVGYDQMCKGISSQFVKNIEIGADVLGIYGMARLGKTTLSKAMCDYFYGEFSGKVCHVELGKVSRAWRQECILKMLCGFERSVMDHIGLDVKKGLTQMRLLIRREPVLLVVDNVTNDVHLQREARDYLTVGFHPKSKMMIMSRSKAILEDILPNMEFFMSMPKLCGEEARVIFLKCAAPMKSILELTSEEPKDNQMLVWKDHLNNIMVSRKDVLSSSKGVFDILNLQFSTFDFSEKLLFVDIALFKVVYYSKTAFHRNQFDVEVEWLSKFHDETPVVIKMKMWDLEKSGMITLGRSGDNGPIDYISVPNLYMDFAEWYH